MRESPSSSRGPAHVRTMFFRGAMTGVFSGPLHSPVRHGIFDEVEERSPDAECSHTPVVASWTRQVTLRSCRPPATAEALGALEDLKGKPVIGGEPNLLARSARLLGRGIAEGFVVVDEEDAG